MWRPPGPADARGKMTENMPTEMFEQMAEGLLASLVSHPSEGSAH